MPLSDLVPTPHRKTTVTYDVPEAVNLRPPWGLTRRANQIALAEQAGIGSSTNVALLPSGAWCLRPLQYGMEFMTEDLQGSIIDLLVVLAIGHIEHVNMQRIPALPGITIATDTTNSGNAFLSRRVPAGEDWSAELAGDAASYAKPVLSSEQVRMRRHISGQVTYPEEQGYCFRFQLPAAIAHTHDAVASFYFGGDTATTPAGHFGGAFCATFLGDGICELRERSGTSSAARQWRKVLQFRYCAVGKVSGQIHSVFFLPHGQRMDLFAESADVAKSARLGHGPELVNKNLVNTVVYTTNKSVVGYDGKEAMTGPGTVRLDGREDLRLTHQMTRLCFKQTGTLVDHVFTIPFALPGGTPIRLRVNKHTPTGTNITAKLFDAGTRAEIVGSSGSYPSVAGQANYYVEFTLTTVNNLEGNVYLQTPFLYSYEIYVAGMKADLAPTPVTGGTPISWSITGPTSDPTLETAHLAVEDLKNELPLLRTRGRIHTRIETQYDAEDGGAKVVLFEGETARATALRKGRSGRVYPSPEWRRYDCPLVSMWARLKDQIYFGQLQMFVEDPEAPSASPVFTPPKITDIIRFCLGELGLPEDMLDIPDLPLRAFMGGQDASEYTLNPTANLVDYLQTLIRDHLGHHLIWDANAGSRGMWRLRPPTPKGAAPLWSFVGTPPGGGPTVAVHPGAYPARTSYYRSFASYVRPPEANYIVVTTLGQMLPDKQGSVAHTAWCYNPKSYNWDGARTMDTNHPDYLGRFVPLVYFNTLLGAVNEEEMTKITQWVCRRLYEQTAHAQKWVRISAPLVLVDDASDAHLTAGRGRRPLRYYDPINIDGEPFFVQSVTMRAEHDHHQQMEVEALAAINTGVSRVV